MVRFANRNQVLPNTVLKDTPISGQYKVDPFMLCQAYHDTADFMLDLSINLKKCFILFHRKKNKTVEKVRPMKRKQVYVLDLAKMEGEGDFSCPGCGTTISPDDCSEETFSIQETKVNNKGLEELVITCNTCGSQLHLTGFSLLEELSQTD